MQFYPTRTLCYEFLPSNEARKCNFITTQGWEEGISATQILKFEFPAKIFNFQTSPVRQCFRNHWISLARVNVAVLKLNHMEFNMCTLVMVYNAQLITPNLWSLDFLSNFLHPCLKFWRSMNAHLATYQNKMSDNACRLTTLRSGVNGLAICWSSNLTQTEYTTGHKSTKYDNLELTPTWRPGLLFLPNAQTRLI